MEPIENQLEAAYDAIQNHMAVFDVRYGARDRRATIEAAVRAAFAAPANPEMTEYLNGYMQAFMRGDVV